MITPVEENVGFEPEYSQGLSGEEAARRLAETGPNVLPEGKEPGPVGLFLRQFLSPFIYMLMIAAVISTLVGEAASAVFIVIVLLLNAGIGTVQEYSAARSAAALRNMVRGTARVVRDGMPRRIAAEDVVPGDIVLLSSGDKVPADLRLVAAQSLTVDESMLTGESLAISKTPVVGGQDDAADRGNRCFAGSVVTHGRGTGLVTATGLGTEIGQIAREVGRRRLSEPPLLIRIRRFTYQVTGGIVAAILLLLAVMAYAGGYAWDEMAMMSIGIAVSTIPEGLPAALTIALAIGMTRMSRENVIIRKLAAVEALGSCTFICSDKTGTLTVNELTIREVAMPGGARFVTTGEGVAPGTLEGEEPLDEAMMTRLRGLCIAGVLANESRLDYAGGDWVSDGDIVDVAFLVLAKKLGMSLTEIRTARQRLDLIPYESERALSASLNVEGAERRFYVKGSPEKILALCDTMLTANGVVPIDASQITREYTALAERGFRVIALADRDAAAGGAADQLSGLTLLGMVGMIDPVRPEAADAVKRCSSGGIGIAMITGDHPETARAIAAEIGICAPGETVVTGPELEAASKTGREALDRLILGTRVFARIQPLQKETIVDSLMRHGHFVAVTGDGVNDAPAMRRANTAVAMGKMGTDVAKEAADLIITDDRFSSIVAGIEQGRVVYNNIRKVIAFLVSTAFSVIVLFFLAVFAGLPMPLSAIQLLWLNLVANGLQDVGLSFEPKEGTELDRPPRQPDEPVFERHIIEHLLVTGGTMGLLAFGLYQGTLMIGYDPDTARNLTLMLMVMFGNIHALSNRSEYRSIFSIRYFANPFLSLAVPGAQLVHIGAGYIPGLRDVLGLQPITLAQWLAVLGVALILLVVEEVYKMTIRHRRGLT